jgi:hypothetical protein
MTECTLLYCIKAVATYVVGVVAAVVWCASRCSREVSLYPLSFYREEGWERAAFAVVCTPLVLFRGGFSGKSLCQLCMCD